MVAGGFLMLQTLSATGCLAKGELASAGGGLLVQQHAGLSLARLGNLTRLSLARGRLPFIVRPASFSTVAVLLAVLFLVIFNVGGKESKEPPYLLKKPFIQYLMN